MIYQRHTALHIQGFSLVETLVAIAILLIVIVGPMSIATNATSSTNFANQQVIAYFLAQEGLELAQKGRDDFLLASFNDGNSVGSNVAWSEFTSGTAFDSCFQTAGCGLEIDDTAAGSVEAVGCQNAPFCQLHLTSATNERSRYTHDPINNEATDFTRVVSMEPSGSNSVLVTVVVSWRTGNQIALQSTTASTYLYNVYGR